MIKHVLALPQHPQCSNRLVGCCYCLRDNRCSYQIDLQLFKLESRGCIINIVYCTRCIVRLFFNTLTFSKVDYKILEVTENICKMYVLNMQFPNMVDGFMLCMW